MTTWVKMTMDVMTEFMISVRKICGQFHAVGVVRHEVDSTVAKKTICDFMG